VALTKREALRLAALMDKVEFPAPAPVFFAWLRNFYGNSVELALLRDSKHGVYIHLVQRPASDPVYAGMWHMPGAVLLPKETVANGVLRCLKKEVSGLPAEDLAAIAQFRTFFDNVNAPRGQERQFLHTIFLTDEQDAAIGGRFFLLSDPPHPLAANHGELIDWIRHDL
jgi:ADP-ribose pyrophosphatase YjhB (NUDIX family)